MIAEYGMRSYWLERLAIPLETSEVLAPNDDVAGTAPGITPLAAIFMYLIRRRRRLDAHPTLEINAPAG